MWIERCAARCPGSFGNVAAPSAQRRRCGIRWLEQARFMAGRGLCVQVRRTYRGGRANAACRHCELDTGGAQTILNEKAVASHGCPERKPPLRRHPRESGDPVNTGFRAEDRDRAGCRIEPHGKAPEYWGPAFASMTGVGVAIVPTLLSFQRGKATEDRKYGDHGSGLPGDPRNDSMLRSVWLSRKPSPGSIGLRHDPVCSSKARGYRGEPRPACAGRPA
jgi:hypothetical protein